MDLSKAVACTAVVLVVVLAAGHALGQGPTEEQKRKQEAFMAACTIKPVMTDAEIDKCREAHRR